MSLFQLMVLPFWLPALLPAWLWRTSPERQAILALAERERAYGSTWRPLCGGGPGAALGS